jgi:hypothetical protein
MVDVTGATVGRLFYKEIRFVVIDLLIIVLAALFSSRLLIRTSFCSSIKTCIKL